MNRYLISRRAFVAAGLVAAAGVRGAAAEAEGEPVSGLPNEGGVGPWDYWRSNERATAPSGSHPAPSWRRVLYDTQPWLFRLSANRIEVIADHRRNLGGLDPYRREFYMGLGCAIENACVAAPSQGLGAKLTLLPNGPSAAPAAILEFEPTPAAPHPHHEAIAFRHTHRGAYQRNRQIEAAVLDALTAQATASDVKLLLIDADGSEGQVFRDLMLEATQRILDVPSLRDGRHAGLKAAAPDGSDASEAAFQKADARWLEMTRTVACATAPLFGLIMVQGSRADHRLHMEAGRLWQRVHLEGTARGLAMQPMNHHIEVIDYEARGEGGSSMAARMNLGEVWRGWEPILASAPAMPTARRRRAPADRLARWSFPRKGLATRARIVFATGAGASLNCPRRTRIERGDEEINHCPHFRWRRSIGRR